MGVSGVCAECGSVDSFLYEFLSFFRSVGAARPSHSAPGCLTGCVC